MAGKPHTAVDKPRRLWYTVPVEVNGKETAYAS